MVALDLAGHGGSGRGRVRHTVAGLADDVLAVADELDLGRVVLVGHSMGGPVSLAAAARMPGRAVAVVAVDTLHDVEAPIPREVIDGLVERFESDFEGSLRAMVSSMVPSGQAAVVDAVVATALRTDRRAAIELMTDFPAVRPAALLERAGVPVRSLNAAPDAVSRSPTAVETNRRHGDFEVVLLDGAGHYPMLEIPEVFEAELRGVLERLPGAAR